MVCRLLLDVMGLAQEQTAQTVAGTALGTTGTAWPEAMRGCFLNALGEKRGCGSEVDWDSCVETLSEWAWVVRRSVDDCDWR